MSKQNKKIAIFQKKEIRKIIYNNEQWFSVVDICGTLTDSRDAGAYWRKLKQRLKAEGSEVVTNCHGLKLEARDGKIGSDYLETILKRTSNIDDDIIIAVENKKK